MVQPAASAVLIAASVVGPATPSWVSPLSFWNAVTAAVVAAP